MRLASIAGAGSCPAIPFVAALAVGCGGGAPVRPAATPPPSVDDGARDRGVDYVAVGEARLLAAIDPLLAHRSGRGHRVARIAIDGAETLPGGADAVAAKIAALDERAGGTLRFVLLVGDAPTEGVPSARGLPTFYRPKLDYFEGRGTSRGAETYATDWPYALAHRGSDPMAVGRVPVATMEVASAFTKKVVAYETSAGGAWQRRIEVIESHANFGVVADRVIEGTATHVLDTDVPYDFDVRVLFPKPDSPYAYPAPELPTRIAGDLSGGALFAAYVGHGAATSFDHARFHGRSYPIGTADDAARLAIFAGQPVFFSIACDTGAFDRERTSIGEALILNPSGAIAVLASSRVSHPYPNALLGQALVTELVVGRPESVGEGIVRAKQGMQASALPFAELLIPGDTEELKEEHAGLYNLLGDPATAIRYPGSADVALDAIDPALGSEVAVTVRAGDDRGAALLTLETVRSVIRGALVPPDAIAAMSDDEAVRAMRSNYELASDKVVWKEERAMEGGKAVFKVRLPADPGEYVLKALVTGDGSARSGHVRFRLAAPPSSPSVVRRE